MVNILELNVSSIGHSTIICKILFSILLFAICDPNYCVKLFNSEQYEGLNDSGVIASFQIGETFDDELLNDVAEDKKSNYSNNKLSTILFVC